MVKGQKAHTNCLTRFTMSACIFLTICKCRTAWEIRTFSWAHSNSNIEWATSSLCLPKEASQVIRGLVWWLSFCSQLCVIALKTKEASVGETGAWGATFLKCLEGGCRSFQELPEK